MQTLEFLNVPASKRATKSDHDPSDPTFLPRNGEFITDDANGQSQKKDTGKGEDGHCQVAFQREEFWLFKLALVVSEFCQK